MRFIAGIFLLTMAACSSSSDPYCADLFDGESLLGWTIIGDAEYAIDDGVIVGHAVVQRPNSFLRTNEEYTDFDLSVDFSIDEAFNSGIQFRSAQASDTLRWDHQAGNGSQFTMVAAPGRVYGYQAEIDPTERAWTGEIYEEGARGWLETFNKDPLRRLIQPGVWYTLRIRAVADSLSTWLDGQPVAELRDTLRTNGFIALQVHSVGSPDDAGKTVRFKNIRLCEVR